MFSYVGWLVAPVLAIAFGMLSSSRLHAGSVTQPIAEPEIIAPKSLTLDLEGFYAGGDLAYAFGSRDDVGHRASSGQLVATPGTLVPGGPNWGLKIGWRDKIQSTGLAFVYGVELGYIAGGIGDSFSTATHQAEIDVKRHLALRLKGGVASIPGDMQFYGILGYARADLDYSVAGTAGGDTISVSDQSDYDGVLLGLGVERALRENLSMMLEYEYTRFSSKTAYDAGGSSTVITPGFGNLRLGLNFAF